MSLMFKIDDKAGFLVYALRNSRVKLVTKLYVDGCTVCAIDKRGRFYSNTVHDRCGREFIGREDRVVDAARWLGHIPEEFYRRYYLAKEEKEGQRRLRTAVVEMEDAAKTLGIVMTQEQSRILKEVKINGSR